MIRNQSKSAMKVTCIALDLDRTTLNSHGRLSERNREALNAAISRGIHVVVASGRALSSLPEDICCLEGIQYAITSNGAAVYEIHTGTCLRRYTMTPESVESILRLTGNREIAYEAFIDGKPYARKAYVEDPVRYGATPQAIPYIQSTREPVEDMTGFIREHIGELDSIDLVVRDEAMKMEFWKLLQNEVPDLYITSSIAQLLEISHRESGKHSGARFLLEYLGLRRENLAAFGDGDNDADLLRYAGMGIAMANATGGCKAAADAITLSNDEDGVAYGIWNFLL